MNKIEIIVFEQVGAQVAVSSDDGDTLCKRIKKSFDNDKVVVLNFENINLVTSTFLNAAIGQLYNDFEPDYIKGHLDIQNMPDDDLVLLKRVVDRAKEYFKNKEQTEKSILNGLNDG